MANHEILADPAFVGREEELKQLKQALNSATEGRGCTILISGKAGSGKTRLTNEFLNDALKANVQVLSGWCLSRAEVPYFPFIEAFNSYSQSSEESFQAGIQNRLLTSWLKEPLQQEGEKGILSPQVWKDQAFAAVTKELLYISTAKPVILVLEDIHWADTASLTLLHYISRALTSERLLIIATFRSEEVSGDSHGYPHPLMETLRIMGREGLFREIKLEKLSQMDTSKIVQSMLGKAAEHELSKMLFDESNGNPLFIIESLRMLRENGSLTLEQDEWRLKQDRVGIPYKVKEIILRRIATLKPNERRILDAASVVGDKFDPILLGAVLSENSLAVLETLNQILHTTSLVKVEDSSFTFDHAMSRETIYDEISFPLKQGYHERVAQQLENKPSVSASELAFHYRQAGDVNKSVEYSLSAGKDALAKYSNAEATKHFSWVLKTITTNTPEKQIALEGLADAYYASNLFTEATKTFEALADFSTGSIRQRALIKAIFSAFFQGNFTIIERLVNRAESYPDMTRVEKARILHQKGVVYNVLKGMPQEGWKLCEQSLQIFEEEYALPDVAWRLFVVADFAAAFGQMEKAVSLVLRSIALYDELGDVRSKMEAYNEAGIVFQHCGLYGEARKMFEKVLELEQETSMGNYIMLAKSHAYLSQLTEGSGDLEGGFELDKKALVFSEKAASKLVLVRVMSNLVRQYAKLGKICEAEALLKKLESMGEFSTRNSQYFLVALAKIVLQAAKGKYDEAIKDFNHYLNLLRPVCVNKAIINFALAEYAWVLNKKEDREQAGRVMKEVNDVIIQCESKFKHANIQAYLVAPINVIAEEAFDVRIDIVNISKNNCSITALKNLIPSGLIIINSSTLDLNNDGTLAFKQWLLEPFSVKTVTIRLQAANAGSFNIQPTITWLDEFNEFKTSKPKPVNIIAKPKPSKVQSDHTLITPDKTQLNQSLIVSSSKTGEKFEFGNLNAEKAFNYLIEAFVQDYMLCKLALDNAGWRTMMEIISRAKLPKSSMYGFERRKGKVLVELERRGLVEVRYFPGQRGRGGKILRLRVSYSKETVRREVDNRILSNKNKSKQ